MKIDELESLSDAFHGYAAGCCASIAITVILVALALAHGEWWLFPLSLVFVGFAVVGARNASRLWGALHPSRED